MDDITPEQMLENLKSWKTDQDFPKLILSRLHSSQTPNDLAEEIGQSFQDCAESTYNYIQYINELGTTLQLDRQNFIPQVAHLAFLVKALRESSSRFQAVFTRYDDAARSGLTRDQFDTDYYDAIQSLDIRELLKKIINEVEAVLKAFSLVTSDLKGIPCLELYEHSIRFQLFLRYFLAQKRFTPEEMWSVLFDAFMQLSEILSAEEEPTEKELTELEEQIDKFKKKE